MYQIQGTIIEQHGKYHVSVKVYRDDALSLQLVFRVWEKDVTTRGDLGDEHLEILAALMSALSRTAEKHERPLL